MVTSTMLTETELQAAMAQARPARKLPGVTDTADNGEAERILFGLRVERWIEELLAQ